LLTSTFALVPVATEKNSTSAPPPVSHQINSKG
jgi:hypothetical protein